MASCAADHMDIPGGLTLVQCSNDVPQVPQAVRFILPIHIHQHPDAHVLRHRLKTLRPAQLPVSCLFNQLRFLAVYIEQAAALLQQTLGSGAIPTSTEQDGPLMLKYSPPGSTPLMHATAPHTNTCEHPNSCHHIIVFSRPALATDYECRIFNSSDYSDIPLVTTDSETIIADECSRCSDCACACIFLLA